MRIKDKGLLQLFYMLVNKFDIILWILLLPVSVTFHILGYRRLLFNQNSIGHLAGDLDCFLKDKELLNLNRKYFIIFNANDIANKFLLEEYSKQLKIIELNNLYWLSKVIFSRIFAVKNLYNYSNIIFGNAQIYRIYAKSNKNNLKIKNNKKADEILEKMGINKEDWFVTIHNRSGNNDTDENKKFHLYRNSSFINLESAINLIISHGGKCIYMGDEYIKNYSFNKNIINYYQSELRSDLLDIYLIKNSKFFLGCTSGLFAVATACNIPVAMANAVPFSGIPYGKNDIFIPKLLKDTNGNFLTIKSLREKNLFNFRHSRYLDKKYNLIENSKEDIFDLCEEMINLVIKNIKLPHHKLDFINKLDKNDYCYGASSKTCTKFIENFKFIYE